MMYKKGSTQIVHFMTPGAGILMLGHGHISHIVNMYYILLYQYTAHWLKLCLGIMMLLSYTMVDFHLFYDGAVDIQIWALLTRSRCNVCDTQVIVKVCRPFGVFFCEKWMHLVMHLATSLFVGTCFREWLFFFITISETFFTLCYNTCLYFSGWRQQIRSRVKLLSLKFKILFSSDASKFL